MRSAAEAAPSFLYVPDLALRGARLTLDGDAARYVAKVVRAREGERLTASDGAGLLATLVVECTRPDVQLAVTDVRRLAPPPVSCLWCGAPEGERGDWLVEKLGELGVTDFQPVDTERVSWPSSVRLDRWERLAVAALRQSRSAWLMRLALPVPLAQMVADLPAGPARDQRWLADPDGVAVASCDLPADGAVTGAVGPSSGFSQNERNLLSSHGFAAVGLAPLRLRTETASVALAAHWAARR